jgi:hypothetical protein
MSELKYGDMVEGRAKALEVTKPAPVRGSNGRFISSK